ncbi:Cobalt-zinc-cadmium resistance protein CzcA Cation efflux system protein CusA OS=Castellaniella defragrans(strain DSM / CCUG 39792 / 65Phen) OX=1437824 GN=BN940_02326 PE=4 SV=1 [Castellaniella denitrificans]
MNGPSAPHPADGGFNLSRWAILHRSLVIYLIAVMVVAGTMAGLRLAQSEDPPFTFRVMVVQTLWPGATAEQVREQVTDRIERKLQEMPHRDYTASYSRPGQSTIFYFMSEAVPAGKVPEEWYQVRKKIGDMAAELPAGVAGPFFNDEFGDVYTNLYALAGDGYTPAQLRDQADILRTVLLRVPGVAKVDYFGDQEERIEVRIPNAVMAQSGLTPARIGQAIAARNAVADPGVVSTASDRMYVRPTGQFHSLDDLADTLVPVGDRLARLGDIAEIRRGAAQPPSTQMRQGGRPVLGIGVTAAEGYDVVDLGRQLRGAVAGLRERLPTGLSLEEVASMPDAVTASVDEFLRAVGEAVAIVLLVSLVSLGLRTGMVVVISIPVVLALTALVMDWMGIGLHKVSLGTLILALGLLVDDAIIAVEMMAVKLEQGWDRLSAAAFAYTSTAFPMLTGTLVTVAGFLPIALARSNTGEYTRSIFQVSAISLLVSWLAAVILIPLLGHALLRPHAHPAPADGVPARDLYDVAFRPPAAALAACLRAPPHRRRRGDAGAVRGRAGGLPAGAAAVLPRLPPGRTLLVDLRAARKRLRRGGRWSRRETSGGAAGPGRAEVPRSVGSWAPARRASTCRWNCRRPCPSCPGPRFTTLSSARRRSATPSTCSVRSANATAPWPTGWSSGRPSGAPPARRWRRTWCPAR